MHLNNQTALTFCLLASVFCLPACGGEDDSRPQCRNLQDSRCWQCYGDQCGEVASSRCEANGICEYVRPGAGNGGSDDYEDDDKEPPEAQLLEPCDPIRVSSRCIGGIGENVVATCQVESGKYQLIYRTTCQGWNPVCYERANGDDGRIEAGCVCQPGNLVCSRGCNSTCYYDRDNNNCPSGCQSRYNSPECITECRQDSKDSIPALVTIAIDECGLQCSGDVPIETKYGGEWY